MAKITCNVVRDLLPLYVDDVLSDDSIKVVEDHISDCTECRDLYLKMKDPVADNGTERCSDGQKALKKIRRSIIKKQLITALITAVCVVTIACSLFYVLVVHEKYIPYEDAALYVSDEAIRSNRNFYKSSGVYTPDGETMFMYMTTTMYTEFHRGGIENRWTINGLTDDALTTRIEDDNGNVTEQVCREIYYVPEEEAKQMMQVFQFQWPENNVEEEIQNLKEKSVLIWEAK